MLYSIDILYQEFDCAFFFSNTCFREYLYTLFVYACVSVHDNSNNVHAFEHAFCEYVIGRCRKDCILVNIGRRIMYLFHFQTIL